MYSSSLTSAPHPKPLLDVETIIRGLSQDFCAAYNTANYDQAANLFTQDGLLMAPHHDPAQGSREIERLLRQHDDRGHENLRFETLRIEISGDIAVEIGRYTVGVRQENGTTFADRGKYVRVWRRFGVWLMVADSWSSNLPPVR